ncbi:MAG: transcriptional regulator [Candidatus Levybacteria bacterium CG_4_10_14_0_8_um_filter_35_23]|nr:MAG: transcriptional regulator [Candidatus Levybacteria bacterium CG22_combo_CG10-13_8_21_14_all_35_11]PIY94678.1 MAG: transcriptional regulator [Candidatus Levybacteria bacterium CG_4_10_14_0_8_um_filter_35_23]PJC54339.1 MAG: transcriptional regulator [Candidatus Levybacteria bacterium CG_4_9_14_0_2_um_filter_35_21]
MYKPKDQKERIIHRLKIAKGHMEKVVKMAEENEYCINIVHQSQAVQSALKKADNLIMENHLLTCVSDAIKRGEQKQAISEVMSVIKKTK